MSIFSELKRRNVLRIAVAYIVSAWLVIQVVETIFPAFGFGDSTVRIVVIVLAIGFIPTLVIAWIFELTPEGWRKEQYVDHDMPVVTRQTKTFDRAIMLILALGLSYFAFDKFVLSESRERQIAEQARVVALADAREIMASNKSIAILPFTDLSEEQNQQFFADGISEEILNILANLEGLNVTLRSSSFQFRAPGQDLANIGERLGVSYVLVGSIRKEVDDLRITARLIEAISGTLLWDARYDRNVSGIFGVQEDIARNVAGELSIVLDVEGRNVLTGARTDDIEAYQNYLKARSHLDAGDVRIAVPFIERALDIDPNYPEALASLSYTVALSSWGLPLAQARKEQERGRDILLRAIDADPTYAEALGMLSSYEWARGNWVGAEEIYQEYIAHSPANILARLGDVNLLGKTGRLRDAVEIQELAHQLDPVNVFEIMNRAERLIQVGRYDDARAALAEADRISPPPSQGGDLRRFFLAIIDNENIPEALATYSVADPGILSVASEILAVYDGGRDEAIGVMRVIYANDDSLTGEGRMIIASLAAYFDDPAFALEVMSKEFRSNLLRIGRIWYPFFSEMRQMPGFKELARDIGFVDYWRSYEWADLCRPLGEDDFECN